MPDSRPCGRLSAAPRLALRWSEEVAAALGVSRSRLYGSGLAALVLVVGLERQRA